MKGSDVELDIDQYSSAGFDQIHSFICTNQSYTGHVLVSSFIHTFGTGSFRATAKLLNTSQVIGIKAYTVE